MELATTEDNEQVTEEQFLSLSPKNKRIVLAKDVLKHLETKQINSNTGSYVSFPYGDVNQYRWDVKDYILNDKGYCHVCAIGALFISEVLYTDKAKVGDINQYFVRNRLWAYFTENQLALIETAFEVSKIFSGGKGLSNDIKNKAYSFGIAYIFNSLERMRAIMQNIIDNDGEFKP